MALMARRLLPLAAILILVSPTLSRVVIVAGDVDDPHGHIAVQNFMPESEGESYCKSESITQVITHPKCDDRVIENKVCIGQCLTYSFPRTDPGDERLSYFCESCQASESVWTNVTMDCLEDDIAYNLTKRVQQITNCSCTECKVPGANNGSRIELPLQEDIMAVPVTRPATDNSTEVPVGDQSPEDETAGNDLLGPPYGKVVGPTDILKDEILFNPHGGRDPNLLKLDPSKNVTQEDMAHIMVRLNDLYERGNGGQDDQSILKLTEDIKEDARRIRQQKEQQEKNVEGEEEFYEDIPFEGNALELPIDDVEDPN